MPLEIVRNDITKMQVDAIVNAANSRLQQGGGVCGAIFSAAGDAALQAECNQIGHVPVGGAVITGGYALPARHIIHTVGPIWQGGTHNEEQLLFSCYTNSLNLALEHNLSSIAFPLISSGIFGYPKDKALKVAISAIGSFILKLESKQESDNGLTHDLKHKSELESPPDSLLEAPHDLKLESEIEPPPDSELESPLGSPLEATHDLKLASELETPHESALDIMVYLVVYDKMSYMLSNKLFKSIKAYIDNHYVDEHNFPRNRQTELTQQLLDMSPKHNISLNKYEPVCEPEEAYSSALAPKNLDEVLNSVSETFTEMLLRLIDEKGRTDSEIYKKANIDRRLFSKIRSNPKYKPGKNTALALSIALELNLDQTADLLCRSGYALSPSSRFDLIVEYFIKERNYNIFEINEALFAFDESLLGA